MTFLPVDVTIDQKAKERHRIDTLNLLAYVTLLVIVLVTTWFFKRRKRMHLHETGLAIIYGLIMGAILRYAGLEVTVTSIHLKDNIPLAVPADYVTIEARNLGDPNSTKTHVYAYEFRGEIQPSAKLGSQISYASVDPEVFFNLILPPIVLNAGLSLKRRHFFRNIGAIFCYAFVGTTISVATVGSLIYGAIHLLKRYLNSPYLASQFSLANCLYFGAIISPTDPLAVLAIFQELGVDVNLFALVFGESILNDAVSIVLTHSIGHFSLIYERDLYYSLLAIIWECTHSFMSMFFLSSFIGIIFGIVTALTTKFTKLTESPLLETSLVVLMSYSSFLTAEVVDASGIVAILLCGITQAHYTINNLSFEARERIKNLFELLTFLCENFLFLAVGVCFWQRGQTWDLTFIGIAFAAITIARALSVYPLTLLLNCGRRNKIPMNYQHLIAWGGAARGVISYSLAARNTIGDARQIMLSTTSVIVIVTVIAVGGLVTRFLKCLKIPFASDGSQQQEVHHYHLDAEHQESVSGGANNPGWLVRPKRLSRRTSGASGGGLSDCSASICSKGVLHRAAPWNTCTCHSSHHLGSSHYYLHGSCPSTGNNNNNNNKHHQHHYLHQQYLHPQHQYNGRHMTPETTPVLEIETAAGGRWASRNLPHHHHHHHGSSNEQSEPDLLASIISPNCSLATLPEADSSSANAPTDATLAADATSSVASAPADMDLSTPADAADVADQLAVAASSQAIMSPYENASLVRRWRNLDNNFIKPLLTNSQPTLLETMPNYLRTLARLFTSDEQLMRQP